MEDNLKEAKERIEQLENDLVNLYRLQSISSKGREMDLQEIIKLRKENHELREQITLLSNLKPS